MARPQGIQNAYKGTSVDLSIICDNLSEIPIVLHAKTTDLFISHLIVSQCEREIPLEKLELMDQALRGIYLLMGFSHSPPSAVDNCACQRTLASNWAHVLDCADFILDSDFDDSSMSHDRLERQISAVLHTATKHINSNLVRSIHGSFRKRTVDVTSRLLMRQDNRVGPPWSNEETVAKLLRYDIENMKLSEFVEATGGDPSLLDILARRLRFLLKKEITSESLHRMENMLFLICVAFRTIKARRSALETVKTLAVIPKTLSKVAAALTSPAYCDDSNFCGIALHTILCSLGFYKEITGYRNLPLAMAIVRLGLFDVILAVSSELVEEKRDLKIFESLVKRVGPLFSHFLPEFLLYGSFVQVVVTALRPLVKDERLSMLWRGVFGDEWLRFERLLLERYVMKKVSRVEANHRPLKGACHNVSIPHAITLISHD